MSHWTTKVLGDPTNFVQAITVDGEHEGRRFIGYRLGRQYWGRGIGTRALTLSLERKKARPLHADPFVGNTGSVRLLQKHGFRPTETVWYGEHEHIMLVLDENPT